MTTISELRQQIHKLTDQLMKKGQEYAEREAYIERRYAEGSTNFSGDLYTVKKRDVLLQDLSGGAKTISAILTAYATVLQAEVAWHESSLSKRPQVSPPTYRHEQPVQPV